MARPARVQRTPIGGPRDILTVKNLDPNYHYRIVNDIPGRIQRFLDAGYEIVPNVDQIGDKVVDNGSKLGSAVTKKVGGNLVGVLMRIPLDWYKEDQVAKQEQIDALELTMRPTDADFGSIQIGKRKI